MNRLLERVCSVSATVGGVILFVVALLITVDVFIRWLVGKPIGGVFEITEVAFLMMVFLSIAFTQYSNRQIRIDILYSLLNEKVRSFLDVINGLVSLIFFGILFWTGTEEFIIAMNEHYVRRGLVEIPTIIPLSFLVFGSILMCITLLFIIAVNSRNIFLTDSTIKSKIIAN
ncbi:MAG: TRAP transporter small permease [Syntrophomonadaceae bacterium]